MKPVQNLHAPGEEHYDECFDSNLIYGDRAGDKCDWYATRTDLCGTYDTEEFKANEMCCVCGGGNPYRMNIDYES